MHAIRLAATAVLFVASFAVQAQDAAPVMSLTIDCAHPALPSQQAVGTLLGHANLAQAYAARTRLMGEARRACHRSGAATVLVQAPMPRARLPVDTAIARK